jgi:D-alanyl-D-alanine carboxypeptidase
MHRFLSFGFAPFLLLMIFTLSPDPLAAAESSIVIDGQSGRVLLAHRAEATRAIASLTKIATVAVALEWVLQNNADLTATMNVTASSMVGGANPLGLQKGDLLPLDSALTAAMMASDNSSALVIAESIGGYLASETSGPDAIAAFVSRMNELAAKLAMKNTHFANPHGLDTADAAGHSSASDLAILARHAYTIPELIQYASSKERTVTFFREGRTKSVRLLNTHELIGSRGVDGLKTGTTLAAGPCLITSAQGGAEGGRADERLIVVVLGSQDRFRETVLLLDKGWEALAAPIPDLPALPKEGLRKGGN